jgi:hypothetical protein
MDRGSTVLVSLAQRAGVRECSCVTTGNLGASLPFERGQDFVVENPDCFFFALLREFHDNQLGLLVVEM